MEPHPVNYRLLEINKIVNNVENVLTLNVADVGAKTDSIKLCESAHSAGSSIMKSSSRCYQVRAVTLDELIENYANNRTLLKMDVEGAEFDIFKSVDPKILAPIERIIMEVHLSYGSPDIIIDKLRSAGFSMRYFHPPLVAKNAIPPINVQDLIGLKLLRFAVYSVAKLSNLKDRNLMILFAWK